MYTILWIQFIVHVNCLILKLLILINRFNKNKYFQRPRDMSAICNFCQTLFHWNRWSNWLSYLPWQDTFRFVFIHSVIIQLHFILYPTSCFLVFYTWMNKTIYKEWSTIVTKIKHVFNLNLKISIWKNLKRVSRQGEIVFIKIFNT